MTMAQESPMHWTVLAPFVRSVDPKWIFEFIDPARHEVAAVPARYDHDRSRRSASGRDWLDYFQHALAGFKATYRGTRKTGIITTFPQLALMVALMKKLTGRKQLPLIAWCFNLAQPYGGLKGKVARYCLPAVDIFVVHSHAEIEIYSRWLSLPASRFVFVPLSVADPVNEPWSERDGEPYIVALGTANRDYRLLVEAVGQLGYKTIIVAGQHAVEDLTPPPCVSVQSGLSLEACHRLAAYSRINVIPIADTDAPSGQVTLIESMMLGVPLVATSCAGTTDYIEDGEDGLLVEPKDTASMVAALRKLWNDQALRQRLSVQAKRASLQKFSFKAASTSLAVLMDRMAAR